MSPMMRSKVVIVTGAGNGIGRDIALGMAAEGAKVVVNDIGTSLSGEGQDAGPAQTVVEEIRNAGGEAIANTQSVADARSAEVMVEQAVETYGHIDAIVNNAGILRDRMFFKMALDEWRAVIDVHLNGAYYMSRAAAPFFKEQGHGALVHMTSTSGLIGHLAQANYSAAKMGIVGLSKSIALDMQRYNVRSNCIAPFAFSRMIANIEIKTPEDEARMAKLRKMDTRKVAPLAVFLCSDAAAEVNGQLFGVRGNELYLFSQIRPIRTVHHAEGWTPQSIAEIALPSLKPSFYSLDESNDVIYHDPI